LLEGFARRHRMPPLSSDRRVNKDPFSLFLSVDMYACISFFSTFFEGETVVRADRPPLLWHSLFPYDPRTCVLVLMQPSVRPVKNHFKSFHYRFRFHESSVPMLSRHSVPLHSQRSPNFQSICPVSVSPILRSADFGSRKISTPFVCPFSLEAADTLYLVGYRPAARFFFGFTRFSHTLAFLRFLFPRE